MHNLTLESLPTARAAMAPVTSDSNNTALHLFIIIFIFLSLSLLAHALAYCSEPDVDVEAATVADMTPIVCDGIHEGGLLENSDGESLPEYSEMDLYGAPVYKDTDERESGVWNVATMSMMGISRAYWMRSRVFLRGELLIVSAALHPLGNV
ncbi:uncharacterized protein K460DRAFT_358489 [Cucurbitaria berberidis CBS 394.84]|uniref:Uncharacterized protein n=1 Tax=Cucurbitaria berberidis CBS 394.84 TaxID=1168544 RepID=A0A9P4GA11_9PLEO|nr:uncharacterized protein K460DRAFT_358489 [Cucurbitaria berberidis CBS 394.84]KAF1841787.1 hypothetical protein K460DRAFT_358489 [Cucurbitaria berberidis CBS 394.84]